MGAQLHAEGPRIGHGAEAIKLVLDVLRDDVLVAEGVAVGHHDLPVVVDPGVLVVPADDGAGGEAPGVDGGHRRERAVLVGGEGLDGLGPERQQLARRRADGDEVVGPRFGLGEVDADVPRSRTRSADSRPVHQPPRLLLRDDDSPGDDDHAARVRGRAAEARRDKPARHLLGRSAGHDHEHLAAHRGHGATGAVEHGGAARDGEVHDGARPRPGESFPSSVA